MIACSALMLALSALMDASVGAHSANAAAPLAHMLEKGDPEAPSLSRCPRPWRSCSRLSHSWLRPWHTWSRLGRVLGAHSRVVARTCAHGRAWTRTRARVWRRWSHSCTSPLFHKYPNVCYLAALDPALVAALLVVHISDPLFSFFPRSPCTCPQVIINFLSKFQDFLQHSRGSGNSLKFPTIPAKFREICGEKSSIC